MRIAHLIGSLEVGGAENLAVNIANDLAGMGEESHLIVTGGPGPLSSRVTPGVHAHYLDFDPGTRGAPHLHPIIAYRQHSRLVDLIRRFRIQVVQTHLPDANFRGLLLALQGPCKIVATVHNNQEFDYGPTGDPVRRFMRVTAYRAIIRRCHRTIAVSSKVRDNLLAEVGRSREYQDKVSVVTNGVRIPPPLSARHRAELRSSLRVGPDQALILAAGRLTAQKNFQDLIMAASTLRNHGLSFRLVIAGQGDLHRKLMGQVAAAELEEVVALPGVLIDLPAVMLAADIFAIPSLWEGMPLALLEGMAAGLPPVGYRIPGVQEVVTDGLNGLTVDPGQPDCLASALARLTIDKELAAIFGGEARSTVRTSFNFESTLGALLGIYRGLIGTESDRPERRAVHD